eukprot:9647854-Alexandrium_andersonii.AAC.1
MRAPMRITSTTSPHPIAFIASSQQFSDHLLRALFLIIDTMGKSSVDDGERRRGSKKSEKAEKAEKPAAKKTT